MLWKPFKSVAYVPVRKTNKVCLYSIEDAVIIQFKDLMLSDKSSQDIIVRMEIMPEKELSGRSIFWHRDIYGFLPLQGAMKNTPAVGKIKAKKWCPVLFLKKACEFYAALVKFSEYIWQIELSDIHSS